MKEIGVINGRKILYQRCNDTLGWSTHLPDEKWLLLAIVENCGKEFLIEIANISILKNVCYVCGVGHQGELLHDITDELRDVKDHVFIMTTWHDSLDDGLWFSLFAAQNDEEDILTVVCLDVARLPLYEEIAVILSEICKKTL